VIIPPPTIATSNGGTGEVTRNTPAWRVAHRILAGEPNPKETAVNRRDFLATAGATVVAAAASVTTTAASPQQPAASGKGRFRSGLVAYSFNKALAAKTMKYEDLIPIVVDAGADGIDLTSYYLPTENLDAYLLSLRRLAYKNRVEIYSVGTRIQLAQATPEDREKQLVDVRKWVGVAQKLGASHIRVFASRQPQGATNDQVINYAAETFKAAADISGKEGIFLGLEDDGGITVHAQETIEIVKRANHPYAGMNLDIGNLRPPKVYDQIEMAVPYAVSSHFKTTVTNDDDTKSPHDWDRVMKMFVAGGYKGYVGLEFEATGDPAAEVPVALRKLRDVAAKYSV
jgi:sugar phosphate isomerase/epimerase